MKPCAIAIVFDGAKESVLLHKRKDVPVWVLPGKAARVRILDFSQFIPHFPAKHDVVDWADAGGTEDELRRMIDQLVDWRPSKPVSSFNALHVQDAESMVSEHRWLVHDMIELGGTCAFAGFSLSGKSFLMVDLAFSVAMGKPFFGRDVEKGLVAYQIGEGDKGFMKRLQGYIQENGIQRPSEIPLMVLPKKVNLFYSDDDTDALIAELQAWTEYMRQPLKMLVIDTFNKATRGANEISGLDIGKVIDRLERIASECKCTVVVVDHLNAQGKFRGHGSKTGDLTNVIMVEGMNRVDHNNRHVRQMRLDKNKDGESGSAIKFVLRQVVVGEDSKGRPITTCVVDKPDGATEEELSKQGKLSQECLLALRALKDVVAAEGVSPPAELSEANSNRQVIEYRHWERAVRGKWFFKADETDLEGRTREIKTVMGRVGKVLMNAGYINKNAIGPENARKVYVWWTGKDDRRRTASVQPTVSPEVLGETEAGKMPF